MKILDIILVLVLALSIPCVFANEEGGSDVIVLSDETFDESLDVGGDWFIEFYAPWCGHCKKLAPIWDELAASAKTFKVAKINCQDEDDIAKRFSIKGFPTLKFFHEGRFYDYRGTRTVEAFIEFATTGYTAVSSIPYPDGRPLPTKEKKETTEEVKPEETHDDLPIVIEAGVVDLKTDTFDEKTKSGVWFIKFFAPWCGHCKKLAPTWEELGNNDRNFNVAKVDCTTDKDLCTKYGVRGYPTLKLFTNGEHAADYTGPRKIENFLSFVEPHTKPAPLKEEL